MTLDQLRDELAHLADSGIPGNTPVVTRGSTPTKLTDATEVRVANTATRKVVVIGKPKSTG